jgi:protein O-mannosyl-transferase
LFWALRSMTGTLWRSALVAALFGLHPLHVESVAWISERKDVLCAFFMFIALLCYSSYVHRQRHKGFYFATLFFFVLGLMAKPMIVTLPFVFLLCDYWPLGRFKTEAASSTKPGDGQNLYLAIPLLVEKIPFFFLSIASCVVTALAQKAGGAMYASSEIPLLFRLSNSLISYMEYIIKMIWPLHLSFFYPLIRGLPNSHWKLLLASVLLLLISSVVATRIKKQPFLLVGWLWFLGTLVPVIGIVQVGSQAMADRYTYIPLIGLFIIIAWILHDLAVHAPWLRIAAVSSCVAVIVLLIYQTRIQAGYWKNDFTLSDHALSVTKYNFLAYTMKGISYYNSGNLDSALTCYNQSLLYCSTQMPPRLNIGCILLAQGKTRESIGIFKELMKIDSTYAPAYLNCGKAFATLGNRDSAKICFSRTLALDPTSSPALLNLGKLYQLTGDCERSVHCLVQASLLDPNDPGIFFELGNTVMKCNKREEAVGWYEKSISMEPSFAAAHRQLAMALDSCGRHDAALRQVVIADSITAARKLKSKLLHPAL